MFDWKDIRTGILLTAIVSVLSGIRALTVKVIDDLSFKQIINISVPLWACLLIIISTIIFCIIFLRVTGKLLTTINTKENKLKDFNSSVKVDDKLLVKWTVYFRDGSPKIGEITVYCNNHPMPVKLLNGECPQQDCINHTRSINYNLVRKDESMVDHRWDMLNNKA